MRTMMLATAVAAGVTAAFWLAQAAWAAPEPAGLDTSAWAAVIPPEKNLPPEWEKSLVERGGPRVVEGEALMKIGMPVSGVCSGLVYLGGDGKLWWWDIFNRNYNGVMPRRIQYKGRSWHGHPPGLDCWQGGNYVEPVTTQPCPFQQGFALRVHAGGKTQTRTLDRKGWKNVAFTGTYPIGTVQYSDPDCPVTVRLEAWSPYCPLDFDRSCFPAVLLRYTVTSKAGEAVRVEIGGWLENAVLLDTGKNAPGLSRVNAVTGREGLTMLTCSVEAPPAAEAPQGRPDIVFEDFEKPAYDGWKVEGPAFAAGPVALEQVPVYQGTLGLKGKRCVNSHSRAPGNDVAAKDGSVGKLISRDFTIERKYITFLVGGGSHPGKMGVHLVVDGKVVRSATGHNNNLMRPEKFDVADLAGKTAHIEIVDDVAGPWGNLGCDHIVFADSLTAPGLPEKNPDFGTMALAAFPSAGSTAGGAAQLKRADEAGLFDAAGPERATAPVGGPLVGGVTQTLTLAAGQSAQAEFALAWHFVNAPLLARGADTGRYYGRLFRDAGAVAQRLAAERKHLAQLTFGWRDTWYEASLPVWFLDRTFISLDCLASTTCYRFADGRFYTWEGVGSCPGHPNHVWHYAQGHARIFPELERDVIERVWFGFGFNPDGSMAYRGEISGASAIDGHLGVLLAVLRDHQMNADAGLLNRIWPRVKLALQYAIARDRDGDGLLDTPMLTTLDEPWYGQIPWVSGLYIAALKAGESMAQDMGDHAFALECRRRSQQGRQAMDEKLFNGEWFVQRPDPANPTRLGAYETCHIDQVLGQSWAWQVGLGRVLNEATTRSALRSLWKYNFALNLDAYDRQANPKPRPYFVDGEGGLVMTANALNRKTPFGVFSPFACYLSEAMHGFEYQAASHMIAEGLVKEGLAVVRAVHDRYDPAKRNPYNEVECGDHYARSMASYGAFISISGFECHGPKGHIGFAPKLNADDFRCAFTSAQGWGSYSQKRSPGRLEAAIEVRYGVLKLATLRLEMPPGAAAQAAEVAVGTRTIPATVTQEGGRVLVTLAGRTLVKEGETIHLRIR